MQKILKGKPVAERIVDSLKMKEQKRCLGVIKTLNNPGSDAYLRGIKKTAKTIECPVTVEELEENTDENKVRATASKMKESEDVDGILLMEPLPGSITAGNIIRTIGPEKDVEGIHPCNLGELLLGTPEIIPSTPGAVLELMKFYGIETEGKEVVIVGRSSVVGKPLMNLLLRKSPGGNATVTVCHSRTRNLTQITKKAEILIVAVGRAKMITNEFVNPDTVVIDVGINMLNGKMVGDVDFESVKDKVSSISPVPGGVGSITTAILFKNLYYL